VITLDQRSDLWRCHAFQRNILQPKLYPFAADDLFVFMLYLREKSGAATFSVEFFAFLSNFQAGIFAKWLTL